MEDAIRRQLEEKPGTVVRHSFRVLGKDGGLVDMEGYLTATEFQGRPAVLGSLLDITDRKRAEARIMERVYKDPLTKLPNSARLMERLRLLLAQARRNKRRFAVAYIDLDHFKFINDTWGHSAGDTFLRVLALRLRRCVREADTMRAGRRGRVRDPDARHPKTANLGTIARKLLSAVSRPINVNGKAIEVTA